MQGKRIWIKGFICFFFFILILPIQVFAQAPMNIGIYGRRVLAIRVNAPRIKMFQGTTQKLYYEVLPTTVVNSKVTFSSSDKKILSVNSKGVMKGLMSGRAVVTVASTDGSGVKSRVTVDVVKKVTKVKNIAHRGLVTEAPENSMAAFHAAVEKGFWGIEFDIQATKDHKFIVMHDSDLARMTNGTGYIKEYNRWELKRLRIDSGKNLESLPTQRIPELSEVLNLCQAYNVVPVIELKEVKVSELPEFLKLLEKYDMEDKAVVISFKMELLEWLRNHSSLLELQWIEKRLSTEHVNECSRRQINIDSKLHSITKKKVKYAHEQDVLVNAWTAVKATEYQRMVSFGVDFITMDMLPVPIN